MNDKGQSGCALSRPPMTNAGITHYETMLFDFRREEINRTVRGVMSHEVNRIIPQSEFDALHANRMMERVKRAEA